MDTCKLCGNGPTIKSHIIPKCMQKSNRGERLYQIRGDKIDAIHYQSGYTENNILCRDCDNFIGKLDNFAKNFLSQDFSKNLQIFHSFRVYVIPLSNETYNKLKRFFASVVLRDSLSKNLLGDMYTQKFKQYVFGEIDSVDEFEVILNKIKDPINSLNIFRERSIRIADRRCYHYVSFSYEFICKIDKRAWSRDLDCLVLKNDELHILEINREDLHDFESVVAMGRKLLSFLR